MLSVIISRVIILVFGTLYPAYASYKAIKTKNVKEYVKWMMYWIVFAFFSCAETFADLFISWFPFYYEFKIVFVLWLLSPATKGSSVLYRKFVHPQLTKREAEIDAYIAKASEQGYHTALRLGSRGISFASDFVLKAAVKGQATLTDHLKRSYSLNDLSDDPMEVEPPTLAPVTSTSSVPASTNNTDNWLMGGERFDKDLPDKDLTPLLTSPEKSSGTRLTHRHTPAAASSNLPEKSTDDAAKRSSRRTAKEVKEVPPRSVRPTTRKSKLATGDVLL